jgi:hypothetical protein
VISNGKWIAMLLVAPAFACDAEPRAWRIVLASTNASGLPSGPFRTFVSGQSTRLYAGEGVGGCWSQFPHMAIDSGNIAYDIETPTEANPWGSRIVLRRLADGTPIRSITTRDPVFSLTVSGTNLVWTEAPRGRAQLTWSIWTSTAAHPEKSLVIEGTAATGGASLPSPVLSNGSVVYGGGRIVAISPGSHTARTISPEGWPCDLLAARRNVVLMTCGGQPSRTVIWKADTGPVVIDGLGEVGTAFLSDDWLLVRGNAEPDVDEIRAIPAASLYGK